MFVWLRHSVHCLMLCLYVLVLLHYLTNLCHALSPLFRNIQPNSPKKLFPDRGMPDGATYQRAMRVPRSSTSRGLRSVRGVDVRSTAASSTPCCTWTITRVCARSCSGSATSPSAKSEQRSGARSAAWRPIAERSTCGSTGWRTRACAGSYARFARRSGCVVLW